MDFTTMPKRNTRNHQNQGAAMTQLKSDITLTEMLWGNLKQAVHEWIPTNFNELKQEWDQIPPH